MTGFGHSLVALVFALLVLAALSPTSYLYRLRIPGAAQLAAWSHAIYLTHKPIAMILPRMLKGGARTPLLEVIVIAGASVAGGWLSYRLVERPGMALRDALYPANFSAPAIAAAIETPRKAA